MTPTLAQALRLRSLGLSVIPVPLPRSGVPAGSPGDGKVPAIRWREFQARFPTEDELSRWFGGARVNLAVVTGALSAVVVIDADSLDALRWCTSHLLYTPWQTRTGHGYHLWYRHPGVMVRNRARLETQDGRLPIDVRGDGGYVIAPGSLHATGTEYIEAGDWGAPRDQVPVFWPGWLQRPPRDGARKLQHSCSSDEAPRSVTRARVDRSSHAAEHRDRPRATGASGIRVCHAPVDRARRYLNAIAKPVIGAGSDAAVFAIACRLVRGFNLDEATAESLLWEWAGGRTGWTREWIENKVANAARYGSEPLGEALQ